MKHKKRNTYLCLLVAFFALNTAFSATLDITIKGIHQPKGNIELTVFSTEHDWLKSPMIQVEFDAKKATNAQYTYHIQDIPLGKYAFFVMHDIDENGELNTGAFGKPVEPYGFSNDARGLFGPAKWKKAVLKIDDGSNKTQLTIK